MLLPKIYADDFQVSSTWRVITGSNGTLYIDGEVQPGSETVTFSYQIPADSTVTSAKVHSIWGATYGPIGGYASGYPQVNGVTNRADNDWTVDVSIDPNATSIDVEFKLLVMGAATSSGDKSSSVDVTDVYLLIEYEPNYAPPTLIDYTDPEPVAGETYVKAIHTNQIRSNVNLVRIARNLAIYSFTPITAGETSLAGWNNHVVELRTAIDEMGITHENWIELGENYPRLDVLMQLRRVVKEVAAGDSSFPSGYTKLSYIQFSGSQYIDTGINATQDTVIEGVCTQEGTVSAYVFGVASTGNTASVTGFFSASARGTWRFGAASTFPTLPKNSKFTFVMNKSGVTLDGSANDYEDTVGTFTTPHTIMLGSGHLVDGTISPSCHVGKFYSFKMWNGSSLVAEFVPCINPNGVYGFWNTISQTFHPSEGSSAFTGG